MIDLRFYWSLLMRRLPVMLALIIICSVFGAVWAIRAPSTYSTSARLLVENPRILDGRDAPGTDSANEMLQVIEQQLLTRANLIDVANKLDVFGRDGALGVDEKLALMRANTVIRRTGGRDEATMMTVTFTSPDPRIAAGVVNEYTTLILGANTRNRVGQAENRLAFFQQEVERPLEPVQPQHETARSPGIFPVGARRGARGGGPGLRHGARPSRTPGRTPRGRRCSAPRPPGRSARRTRPATAAPGTPAATRSGCPPLPAGRTPWPAAPAAARP